MQNSWMGCRATFGGTVALRLRCFTSGSSAVPTRKYRRAAPEPGRPPLESVRGRIAPNAPSLRLAAAVLDDALDTILHPDAAPHRHWLEAVEWLSADHFTHLFAFRTICDLLELDAARVRRVMKPWVQEQSPGAWRLDGWPASGEPVDAVVDPRPRLGINGPCR